MYNEYPRVTHILKLLHNEKLMHWSNFMGRVCKLDYKDIMEEAQNTGTKVHNIIEDKIRRKPLERKDYNNPNREKLSITNKNSIRYAVHGFDMFMGKLKEKGYNVNTMGIEVSMVSQIYKYRGTCDWLVKINDKLYLIDFKSGKDPYPKMFLQLAAYTQMLREMNIYVDKVAILALDKKTKNRFKFVSVNANENYNQMFPIFNNLLNIKNSWDNIESMRGDYICNIKENEII